MPIINGEKYACQSCIKGHRVSGCQHTDRELQHINPKGRPVKQCEHCRNSRKTKSHHARCECGHKKEKGTHKVDEAHAGGCACHTGSKCICGSKKDHGLKLETSGKPKPRLTATQSETTLTVFANGHHKPCHRLNNSAHISGLPYKIPRPHTLHGPPVTAHHSSENVNNFYGIPSQQRSLDHLALPEIGGMPNFNTQPRASDSQPLTPIGSVPEDDRYDPFKQLFGVPQVPTSVMGSGPNSPVDNLTSQQQWPWTAAAPQAAYGYESLSTSPAGDYPPHDNDWAIPSAGLQPSWSATDLPLHPEKFGDSVQPISHCGESARASVPGLSTSSSQSEMGEPNFFGELDMKHQVTSHEPIIWEDPLGLRRARPYRGISNASTPPEMRQAPTSAPTPEGHQSRTSLDLDFLRRNSPPLAAETDRNYIPQRTFTTLTEAFSVDQKTHVPTGNPFMGLDSRPRSMTLPRTIEENSPNTYPWSIYSNPSEMARNPFEGLEMPAFPYGDNFS